MSQFRTILHYNPDPSDDWDKYSSKSEVIVAYGMHRVKPVVELPPETSPVRTSSTQTLKHQEIKPIILDLNNLQPEEKCPDGCKVDVYVTARHCPDCSHKCRQTIMIGARNVDYVGKGTYRYQVEGEEDVTGSYAEYQKKCDEFTAKCDKLLDDMSKPIAEVSPSQSSKQKVLKREMIYHVIDKYSIQEESVNDKSKVPEICDKLTKSEVDLYEWNI